MEYEITQPRSDVPLPTNYKRLVGRRTGIIKKLYQEFNSRGEPEFYAVSPSDTDEAYLLGVDRDITYNAGGKGSSIADALTSAVGELAERYSLSWIKESQITNDSYTGLVESGKDVVDFSYLRGFIDPNREAEDVGRDTSFNWTEMMDTVTGDLVMCPADMVWSTYELDEQYFVSTTSGAAAGPTVEHAVLNGLYEYIERDAFMTDWCRRRVPDRIDHRRYPELREAIEEFDVPEGIEVHFLELNQSVENVHCIAVSLVNDEGVPKFGISADASVSMLDAARSALLEALQTWIYNKRYMDKELDYSHGDDLALHDNLILYSKPERFDKVEFLLAGEETDADFGHDSSISKKEELELVLEGLENSGYRALVKEVTTRDVEDIGINVVRTVVPQLLPLTTPSSPPKNHPKLDGVDVNPHPHPFP